MRILCDEMLGRLARDLRLLGHDATYAETLGDEAILAQARAEGRVLLTGDRDLARRAGEDALLVPPGDHDERLRGVLDRLGLGFESETWLSRCPRCNCPLAPDATPARELPSDAPRDRPLLRCPGCGRRYWEGSHTARIRERLARLSGAQAKAVKPREGDAPAMSEPRIRALTLRDVERIMEIDSDVTKTPVKTSDNDLWRLIAETTTCFGAEQDGRLVGFVLADIRPWEFGRRAHVGWIIALGVDPKAQGHGIGRRLGERVLDQFQRLGVTRIQTLVEPETADLEEYFKSLGFKESPARVLVKDQGAS